MENFVKGEHVVAHSKYYRDRDENLIVVSVGTKYITCVYEGHEDGRKIKFSNDEHRTREDWMSYNLYHSLEEIEEEEKNDELRKRFKNDAERNYFSIDEIKQFYAIHNHE